MEGLLKDFEDKEMEGILKRLEEELPSAVGDSALVYIAIGCANSPQQQRPPFLKHDRIVLVLIDRCLEQAPVYEGCHVIAIREYWEWAVNTHGFFERLLAISPDVRVIVQEFTGLDINPFYPFHPPHPRLLFDASYGRDECCQEDMLSVRLLTDERGGFIHPMSMYLRQLRDIDMNIMRREVMSRRDTVCQFLFPRLMVLEGQIKEEAWHEEQYILAASSQILRIYGDAAKGDNFYRSLLTAFWEDLAAVAGLTCAECPPDAAYRRTVNALCLQIWQSSE